MEKEQLIELFYEDYYLQNLTKNKIFKRVEFDKQAFYIFSKINKLNKFRDINQFIEYYSKKFFVEKISLKFLKKEDSLKVEKALGNISYPFIINIDRLKILENSITEDLAIKIFGMSFSDIYKITGLIILRTLLYNDYLSNKKMTSYERINFFGTTKANCYFTAKELQKLNMSVELDKIEKYLEFFSIDSSKLYTENDTKRILKINGKYVVLFMNEFCTFLFNYCEQCIIEYLKSTNDKQLQQYYKQRGESFEKYVKDILKNLYFTVMSKVKYVDNNHKQMEIDNLILEDGLCLNFECKSAGFNIYDSITDDETLKQLHRAFGRGYYSIDTFYKTIKENKGIMKFKINNHEREYDLSNKKIIAFNVTMYPVEFLSTSIHFFDENSKKNITTFPITINVMDLHSIILISTMNKNIFNNYSIERFHSINEMGKFKIDFDEIDAFGYILDFNLKNGYQMMKKLMNSDNNIEQHIMINNSVYREEVNQQLAWYGFNLLADIVLSKDILKIFKKMLSKRTLS